MKSMSPPKAVRKNVPAAVRKMFIFGGC
jgi:hypothetical protein